MRNGGFIFEIYLSLINLHIVSMIFRKIQKVIVHNLKFTQPIASETESFRKSVSSKCGLLKSINVRNIEPKTLNEIRRISAEYTQAMNPFSCNLFFG